MKDQIKPKVTIGRTRRAVANQGYTFNESNMSFNESGVQFGGLYEGDIIPMRFRGMDYRHISPLPPTPPGGNTGLLVGVLSLTYP